MTAMGSTKYMPRDVPDSAFDDTDFEHSDVDIDIRRMSTDAMAILDSITDEVAELTSSKKGRKRSNKRSSSKQKQGFSVRQVSPDASESSDEMVDDLGPHPDYHEMAMLNPNTDALPGLDPSLNPLYGGYEDDGDDDREDDDDDHGDDISDDESLGSFAKELSALRTVTMQIERELKSQDVDTMRVAMSRIENSPGKASVKKQLLSTDDKEIIKRILEDEMEKEKQKQKNALEAFIHNHGLYGPGAGGEDLNYPLLGVAIAIWAIVIGLCVKVMFGEI